MTVTAMLFINVLCIAVCHYAASRRGAKPAFWAAMAALFGPFAVPFAFRAKPAGDINPVR